MEEASYVKPKRTLQVTEKWKKWKKVSEGIRTKAAQSHKRQNVKPWPNYQSIEIDSLKDDERNLKNIEEKLHKVE